MGDEVIECAVAENGLAAGRDQPIVVDGGIPQKNVGRNGIWSNTTHTIVFVEEEPLTPSGIAYIVLIMLGGI
jgi:hypothetical protein